MPRKKIRRKKRRIKLRLSKGAKIIICLLAFLIAVGVIIGLCFKVKTVKVSSDINQYSSQEVQKYLKYKGMDNTFWIWFKNILGNNDDIELFEEYSVSLNSPTSITLTVYEKKLKGYVENQEGLWYIDENGKVLKSSAEKVPNVPKIVGLECGSLKLYQNIKVENEDGLNTVLNIVKAIEGYPFEVKQIKVSNDKEITLSMKKCKVDLGRLNNDGTLETKLIQLKDMYSQVTKLKGTLNMKTVNTEGKYTFVREMPKKKKRK